MTFLLQQLAEHLLILGTFDMGEGASNSVSRTFPCALHLKCVIFGNKVLLSSWSEQPRENSNSL